MADLKPLALTDEQLGALMAHAGQLHVLDRDAFLRAVADRFAGKSEIGEGEFARALTSAFGEELTCPDMLPAASRSKMPSRPGAFHPEPLTDPDMNLSIHPARAIARRLPPSIDYRVPPVAG